MHLENGEMENETDKPTSLLQVPNPLVLNIVGYTRRFISIYSKALKEHETRYPATKLELFGVVKGIQHFHHFLYGRKFVLLTDHKPLEALFKSSNNLLTTTMLQ